MFDLKQLQNNKLRKNSKFKKQKLFIIGASVASLVATGGGDEKVTDDDVVGGDVQGVSTSSDDVIATGGTSGGTGVVNGSGGDDTITGGVGVDYLVGGAGVDNVNGGAGLDHLGVIGVTVNGSISEADLRHFFDTGEDLSNMFSLEELNEHPTSDIENGDVIDGGADGAILYLIGKVDLTGAQLANITTIYLNDEVIISPTQLQSLVDGGLTGIFGAGVIKASTGLFDFDAIEISDDIAIQNSDGDEVVPTAINGVLDSSVDVTESNTLVGKYSVTDESAVGDVSYALSGDDAELFEVAADGTISFKSAPDFGNKLDDDQDGVYDFTVTATDSHARTSTLDVAVTVIDENIQHSGEITISGTVTQGETLSFVNNIVDEDGIVSSAYQWQRDGVAIDGETGETYELQEADVGAVITIEVTFLDEDGHSEIVVSAPSIPVVNVNDALTGDVVLEGLNHVGETLTIVNTLADADGLGDMSYQWTRDGVAIDGATQESYVISLDDMNSAIAVTVSYTDGHETDEEKTSDATLDVQVISVLELADITPSEGLYIQGETADDFAGELVANIGDINGDRLDDFIINAPQAGADGLNYVIFGNENGIPTGIDLSALTGTDGFKIVGPSGLRMTPSFSAANDVNGDGYDDFLIGVEAFDGRKGITYVMFGKNASYGTSFDLSTMTAADGFKINGEASIDFSGTSVAGAGDVNGDGFDDILIGAKYADPNGTSSGAAYVVFGSGTSFGTEFNLVDIDGLNGFKMEGTSAGDYVGGEVSAAGDINGDGLSDIAIGAPSTEFVATGSGSAYILFGTESAHITPLQLADLTGADGFRVDGEEAFIFFGGKIAKLGDVNGDGFDDIILGTPQADFAGSQSGSAYVIFGAENGFAADFTTQNLDGSNGFRIDGVAVDDGTAQSVSSAGDVNGDGYADILIGAAGVGESIFENTGAVYVVYGTPDGFESVFDLSTIDGTNGFRIDAAVVSEYAGISVSSAGDVNYDGYDDLLVGANKADFGGLSGTYIVYGGAHYRAEDLEAIRGENTIAGDSGDNIIYGGVSNDHLTGNAGNDIIVGGQGVDYITGGAGADTLTGGVGTDVFYFNHQSSILDITGSGDAGIVSGYDVITDFQVATATEFNEVFAFSAALASVVADGVGNTADSGVFTIDSNVIDSHSVVDGMITFDDAATFSTDLDINSESDVAAVLSYLQATDFGDLGATLAFNYGADTFVYIQGSDDGADNDFDVTVKLEDAYVDALLTTRVFGEFDLFIA